MDDNKEAPGRRGPEPVYCNRNLQVIFAVTLMAVLGVSSITPAFPGVAKHLGVSAQQVSLLITLFTVPGVVLTPLLGLLADRYGRKVILIPSLLLFGIAGGLCVFAASFRTLLALRVLQGIGAASLGSLNITIIADLYEDEQRAAAMGYNATVLSVGTASYPTIGGALATIGWRYPFALAWFGVIVGVCALFWLDNPEPSESQSIGRYLRAAWDSVKGQQAVALLSVTAMTFVILYGVYLSYMPFLIETAHAGTPLIIGLVMSAMSLCTAVTSAQLGRLTERFAESKLLQAGFAFYAIGLVLMPASPNLACLVVAVILFGVGHGLNIPSAQTMLSGIAPMEHRAAFMSVNGMVVRLGQTVGPIIASGVYTAWGFGGAFWTAAGAAAVTVLAIRLAVD